MGDGSTTKFVVLSNLRRILTHGEGHKFCNLIYKKVSKADTENNLMETFIMSSKDNEGCIQAEEL